MSVIIYINGQIVDTDNGTQIAQTKQINDLNSLSDRQANYTNRFKLPKTANNIRIMQYLSLPGNNSNVPYQKNECSMYSETGECFVYKGWAVVDSSDDGYNIAVYDGIIDLYKAIENQNLSSLGLEDLTHEKTVANVVASWNTDLPYTYILADFNGFKNNTTGTVSIDYIVPSINVAWLWNKIFEVYGAGGLGIGYSGTVFLMENFKNLWLTYPKGVSSSDAEITVFSGTWQANSPQGSRSYLIFSADEFDDDFVITDGVNFAFTQAGYYRIEVIGGIVVDLIGQDRMFFMSRNSAGIPIDYVLPNRVVDNDLLDPPDGINYITFTELSYFNANEGINFIVGNFSGSTDLTITITKINGATFDFNQMLSDFSIRDFLTEIVHRFGLTMYKDKYSNKYEFLTLQEQLQTSDVVDWSSKFSKIVSEAYIYGSYAQQNWLRYTYNDKEETHNDFHIDIANANLADSKDVIKSKIYSPEMLQSVLLGADTNVYKLWDKDIEQVGAGQLVKYKPLDKRYYLLRRVNKNQHIDVVSEQLGQSGSSEKYCTESFFKLSFSDVIQEYYGPLNQILKKSQVLTVDLFLKDTDIVNFDFKKLYYIEQLSSYFIVNKINNYVPGKVTRCELVRVLYAPL